MEEQGPREYVSSEWLFARLPGWVHDTMSPEQKEAIHQAVSTDAQPHPINIRLHVPWFRRRYFLTVVGGEEQRSAERRAHERHRYPLRTVANIFFFVGLAAIFYVIALLAIGMHASIIEF
jgi:hypothetical protein